MNYIGLNPYDKANGPGIRVSLFVSGCSIHCKGCFNQASWSFKAGKLFTPETKQLILTALEEPAISGFSLLGGDPFEPEHEDTLVDLCKDITKPIWCWTGRELNQIQDTKLIKYIHTIISGPFKEDLKVNHIYYGSSNQHINYLRK